MKPVEVCRTLLKLCCKDLGEAETSRIPQNNHYLAKDLHVAFEFLPLCFDGAEPQEVITHAKLVTELLMRKLSALSS